MQKQQAEKEREEKDLAVIREAEALRLKRLQEKGAGSIDVKQSIEEFVKKQEAFLKKKFENQEKLTKLIVLKEASHEPKINKKSKEIASKTLEANEEVHERLFKANNGEKSMRRSRSRGKSIGDLTVATVKS